MRRVPAGGRHPADAARGVGRRDAGRAFRLNSSVDTLTSYRLADFEGVPESSTSTGAPTEARRAVERAREHVATQQFPEAEKEMNKAVQLYPEYGGVWQDLGVVLQVQGRAAEARKVYSESLASGAKFLQPYLNLARLWAIEQKWQDVLERTGTLLHLDPYPCPETHYYSAVAHYNLNDPDHSCPR